MQMKLDVDMESAERRFVEEGIWVRPFGKLVYVMPAYIISEEDLTFLCTKLLKVVKEC